MFQCSAMDAVRQQLGMDSATYLWLWQDKYAEVCVAFAKRFDLRKQIARLAIEVEKLRKEKEAAEAAATIAAAAAAAAAAAKAHTKAKKN